MSILKSNFSKLGLTVAPLLFLTACSDSDLADPLSGVEVLPPVVLPPQSNVNITNPTLTVANNTEVGGGALTLVWSDEFDGAQLDPATWFFETGDGTEYGIPGWGNNEQQYYLPDNAQLANGLLTITAQEQSVAQYGYTSARINTRDRFAFTYGRIEARIRLPEGQGLWPAFWLLSQGEPYGSWPQSGEIDIMEAVNLGGTGGNDVLGTLHYGPAFPNNIFTGNTYTVPSSATADFHDYAIEWDSGEIRWYVDGVMYAMQNSWSTPTGAFPAPFDQPFYIILNVAVGGNLPGAVGANTVFPVTMDVDYIRVYSGS